MTPEEIARAKEIIAAATFAPWHSSPSGYDGAPYIMSSNYGILARHTSYGKMREDAEFIVAARDLLPRALEETERLKEKLESREIDALESVIDELYRENKMLKEELEKAEAAARKAWAQE